MTNWIKKLFTKRKYIVCGGVACCEVTDKYGKVMAEIWYRRPTSDEVFNYMYDVQFGLASESNVKELSGEKSIKERAKKCHEIMLRDLSLPYAELIFDHCIGFYDDKLKDVFQLSKEEQFAFLGKYRSHNLIDLVIKAFETDGTLKKKD